MLHVEDRVRFEALLLKKCEEAIFDEELLDEIGPWTNFEEGNELTSVDEKKEDSKEESKTNNDNDEEPVNEEPVSVSVPTEDVKETISTYTNVSTADSVQELIRELHSLATWARDGRNEVNDKTQLQKYRGNVLWMLTKVLAKEARMEQERDRAFLQNALQTMSMKQSLATLLPSGAMALSTFSQFTLSLLGVIKEQCPQFLPVTLRQVTNMLQDTPPLSLAEGPLVPQKVTEAFDDLCDFLISQLDAKVLPEEALTVCLQTLMKIALTTGSLRILLSVINWLLTNKEHCDLDISTFLDQLGSLKSSQKLMFTRSLAWGQSDVGQLGSSAKDDQTTPKTADVPCLMSQGNDTSNADLIKDVAAGGAMSAWLAGSGELFVSGGSTDISTNLNLNVDGSRLPVTVPALANKKIESVAIGDSLYAVTDTGELYVGGINAEGQLGLSHTKPVHGMTLLEDLSDKHVVKVAASVKHCMAVTENGELFSWGANNFGQCALGHTRPVLVPTPIAWDIETKGRVVDISLGFDFSYVVSDRGEVWVCGANDFGQLGLDHSNSKPMFQKQPPLTEPSSGSRVLATSVRCGDTHALIIGENGSLFACGSNEHGELGLGDYETRKVPMLIHFNEPVFVSACVAGDCFSSILTDQGRVFTMGSNMHGQLGIGNRVKRSLPQEIRVRSDEGMPVKVTCLSAGSQHVVACGVIKVSDESMGSKYAKAVLQEHPLVYYRCNAVARSGGARVVRNLGSLLRTDAVLDHDIIAMKTALIQEKTGGSFDMTDGGVLSIAHSRALNLPSDFTVEMWLRLSEVEAGCCPFSSFDEGSSSGFKILINESQRWTFQMNHTTVVGDGVSKNFIYHLVASYSKKEMTFYVNGRRTGSAFVNLRPNRSQPMMACLNGSIAEIAVYPNALPRDVIQEHYDIGSASLCTSKQGEGSFVQPWYHCNTCNITGEEGICRVCMFKCHQHKGHEVKPAKISKIKCACCLHGRFCESTKPAVVDSVSMPDDEAVNDDIMDPSSVIQQFMGTMSFETSLGTDLGPAGISSSPTKSRADPNGNAPASNIPTGGFELAVCLLSQLDRLSQNFGPQSDDSGNSGDNAHLRKSSSQTSAQPLCVELKAQTFEVFYEVLKASLSKMVNTVNIEQEPYAMYPLLACLRLLKVNFYNLANSGIRPQAVGLYANQADESEEDSLLSGIRSLLFDLCDGNYPAAVKAEAMRVVSVGFSILFPTTLKQAGFLASTLRRCLEDSFSFMDGLFGGLQNIVESVNERNSFTAIQAFADDFKTKAGNSISSVWTSSANASDSMATLGQAESVLLEMQLPRMKQSKFWLNLLKDYLENPTTGFIALRDFFCNLMVVMMMNGFEEMAALTNNKELPQTGLAAQKPALLEALKSAQRVLISSTLHDQNPHTIHLYRKLFQMYARVSLVISVCFLKQLISLAESEENAISVSLLEKQLQNSFVRELLHSLLTATTLFENQQQQGEENPASSLVQLMSMLLTTVHSLNVKLEQFGSANTGRYLLDLEETLIYICGKVLARQVSAISDQRVDRSIEPLLKLRAFSGGLLPNFQDIVCGDNPLLSIVKESEIEFDDMYQGVLENTGEISNFYAACQKKIRLGFMAKRIFKGKHRLETLRMLFFALLKHSRSDPYGIPSEEALAIYKKIVALPDWVKRESVNLGTSIDNVCDMLKSKAVLLLALRPSAALRPEDEIGMARPSVIRSKSQGDVLSETEDDGSSSEDDSKPKRIVLRRQQTQDVSEEIQENLMEFIRNADVDACVVLEALQQRFRKAMTRVEGLALFAELLESLKSSTVRRELVDHFADTFLTDEGRAHYSVGLEGCGDVQLSEVRKHFFAVVRQLLLLASHTNPGDPDNLVIFQACALPYVEEDFTEILSTGLIDLIKPMLSWSDSLNLAQSLGDSSSNLPSPSKNLLTAPPPHGICWSSEYANSALVFTGQHRTIQVPETCPSPCCVRCSHGILTGILHVELNCLTGCEGGQVFASLVDREHNVWNRPFKQSQLLPGLETAGGAVEIVIDLMRRYVIVFTKPTPAQLTGSALMTFLQQNCTKHRIPPSQIAKLNDHCPLYLAICVRAAGLKIRGTFKKSCPDHILKYLAVSSGACGIDTNKNEEGNVIQTCSLVGSAGDDYVREPEIFVCGQNAYNELMLGANNTTNIKEPEKVEFFENKFPTGIAAGNEMSGVVCSSGEVYTCGYNKYGMCGVGKMSERIESPQKTSLNEPASEVIMRNGCEQSFFLTANGDIFSAGFNQNGQLGLGNTTNVFLPKRVPLTRKALKLACSYKHTLIYTEGREIFGVGNNEFGELGMGHNKSCITPRPIPAFHDVEVRDMACGYSFSVVVIGDGRVLVFGSNKVGELGLGDDPRYTSVNSPMELTNLPIQSEVKNVACGYYHTLLLTRSGQLMASGRNRYGQCGVGSDVDQVRQFKEVKGLNNVKIRKVTCGTFFTYAVTTEGKVYAWGSNRCGQLADGGEVESFSPKQVTSKILLNKNIIDVACGFHHVIFICGEKARKMEQLKTADDSRQNQLCYRSAAWCLYRLLSYSVAEQTPRMRITDDLQSSDQQDVSDDGSNEEVDAIQAKRPSTAVSRNMKEMIQKLFGDLLIQELQNVHAHHSSSLPLTGALPLQKKFTLDRMTSTKFMASLHDKIEDRKRRNSLLQSGLEGDELKKAEGAVRPLEEICVAFLRANFVQSLTDTDIMRSLYRNQLLWVLLRCTNESDIIAKNILTLESLTLLLQLLFNNGKITGGTGATLVLRICRCVLPFVDPSVVDLLLCQMALKGEISDISFPIGMQLPHLEEVNEAVDRLRGHDLTTVPQSELPTLNLGVTSDVFFHMPLCLAVFLITLGRSFDSEHSLGFNFQMSETYDFIALSSDLLSLLRLLIVNKRWATALNVTLMQSLSTVHEVQTLLEFLSRKSQEQTFNNVNFGTPSGMTPGGMTGMTPGSGLTPGMPGMSPTKGGTPMGSIGTPMAPHEKLIKDPVLECRQKVWCLIGALSVIGGQTEVLREGCKVKLTVADSAGQIGTLLRYRRVIDADDDNMSQPIGEVHLGDNAEIIKVYHENDIVPCGEVPLNVQKLQCTPRLLPMLVEIMDLTPSQQLSAYGSTLHLQIRMRTCLALDCLLQNPGVVSQFIRMGHLPALVAQLSNVGADRLAKMSSDLLMSRLVQVEFAKQRLVQLNKDEFMERAKSKLPPLKKPTIWACKMCSYHNPVDIMQCEMCYSPRDDNPIYPEIMEQQEMVAMGGTAAVVAEKTDDGSTTVRTWDLAGVFPRVAGSKIEITGDWKWQDVELENQQRTVLSLAPGSYVNVEHGFGMRLTKFDESEAPFIYMNKFTIVMDICPTLPEDANLDFIPLLQMSDVAAYADLYMKRDGSVGCVTYSCDHVLDIGKWSRLTFAVDTIEGFCEIFVNGTLVHRMEDNDDTTTIIPDDRWAMDTVFRLFHERDGSPICEMLVAAFQLRNYVMVEEDIIRMGGTSAVGIPSPSVFDVAKRLSETTHLPEGWWMQALKFSNGQLKGAQMWMDDNRSRLLSKVTAEAQTLVRMGYPLQLATQALMITGHRMGAIAWLLEHGEKELKAKNLQLKFEVVHTDSVQKKTSKGEHVGKYVNGRWRCCLATSKEAAGCTPMSGGRIGGPLRANMRIRRGRDWKWGPQDNNGFGTVVCLTNWSNVPDKGVRLKWDNGYTNVYRWGHNSMYDVEVVGELADQDDGSCLEKQSAADNPAYAIKDQLDLNFGSTDGQGDRKLPSISGLDSQGLDTACLDLMTALCVSAARHATASLLQYSMSSVGSSGGNVRTNNTVFSLLNHDSFGGKHFLREYLSAFPDGLDLRRRSEQNQQNPVSVVRHKLGDVLLDELKAAKTISDNKVIDKRWQGSLSKVIVEDAVHELLLIDTNVGKKLSCGLQMELTDMFDTIWTTEGLDVQSPIGFFRPRTPRNCVSLGDVLVLGHDAPTDPVYVVVMANDDLCRSPASFKQVWTNKGMGGGDVSVWEMVPPNDYVALGYVVTNSLTELPDARNYACVKKSITIKDQIGQCLWTDIGSRAVSQVSFWEHDIDSGTFFAHHRRQRPSDEVYSLIRSDAEKGNPNLAIWLLQFLLDMDDEAGFGPFAEKVFRVEMLHLLLRLSTASNTPQRLRIRTLRLLGAVLRHVPLQVLTKSVIQPLGSLRETMESLYASQANERGMFSSYLQALVEVMVCLHLKRLEKNSLDGEWELLANDAEWGPVECNAEWFRKLVEVGAITEALMDRAKKMPESFLLSEDTLLRLMLVEETKVIESEHPYNQIGAPIEGEIKIDDARCITIRTQANSETKPEDSICFYANRYSKKPIAQLQGAIGAQTIVIPSNSCYYKFPVKCSISWTFSHKKRGAGMKLVKNRKSVTYTRNKTWQSIMCTEVFSTGVHSWEVQVEKVTSAANIFFGVSQVKSNLVNSYCGKDQESWGWIGCMALWHEGKKLKTNYGKRLSSGDVVRVTLDLNARTIAYAVNGIDYGIAFTDLPADGQFVPAFSMYNSSDKLVLRSCAVMTQSHTLGARSVVDSHPPHRRELAEKLVPMGFSLAVCLKALQHCSDNHGNAVEMLLTNSDELQAEVDLEQMAMAEQERQQMTAAEVSWFLDMVAKTNANEENEKKASSSKKQMSSSNGGGDSSDSQWQCVACTYCNSGSAAVCELCGTPSPDTKNVAGNNNNANDGGSLWGFKFSAMPEYSKDEISQVTAKHTAQLERFNVMNKKWTFEQDEELVQLVNQIAEKKGLDGLEMSPDEVILSPSEKMHFPALANHSTQDQQLRFLILRNFNRRLAAVLPLIDLSRPDHESHLTRMVRRLRGVVLSTIKRKMWKRVIETSSTGDASEMQRKKFPVVTLDRNKAALHKESTRADNTGTKSLYGQLFQQLRVVPVSAMRNSEKAWHTRFLGEYGDDYGGLYRETMTQICNELASESLPLLLQSPNGKEDRGLSRDSWIPNSAMQTPTATAMFAFLGQLFGVAVRTGNPLDLVFPSLIWKPLVGQEVTLQDLRAIDENIVDFLKDIRDVPEESWSDVVQDLVWITHLSNGEEQELFAGGSAVPVKWSSRDEYCRMAERVRLDEFKRHTEAIKRGLSTQIPINLLTLFTWHELELMVCGRPTVDVELLRENTIYGDNVSPESFHIKNFWEIIREFNDKERQLYLRFVWGRSRLPLTSADFPRPHKINVLDKPKPDDFYPVSHTCFFSLDLPVYSTKEIMRERLLYAIINCQAIDTDNTAVAREAAEDNVGWTQNSGEVEY